MAGTLWRGSTEKEQEKSKDYAEDTESAEFAEEEKRRERLTTEVAEGPQRERRGGGKMLGLRSFAHRARSR
jgi:hypothetical protein